MHYLEVCYNKSYKYHGNQTIFKTEREQKTSMHFEAKHISFKMDYVTLCNIDGNTIEKIFQRVNYP